MILGFVPANIVLLHTWSTNFNKLEEHEYVFFIPSSLKKTIRAIPQLLEEWSKIFGDFGSIFILVFTDAGNFMLQFINVYAPRYESAGKFWPIVHDSMIFSLVLMHAIAVGIFSLKKLSLASTLLCPLPVLTLLFNEYCRKRFLPNFVAYSAEVGLKAMAVFTPYSYATCGCIPSFHCAFCISSFCWPGFFSVFRVW